MSIADKLTAVAENVPKVYEAGKNAEYEAFWDETLQNGNRTSFRYAFGGEGWTNKTFRPPTTIFPEDSRYMFSYSGISSITHEQVDFDRATDLRDCFYCCYKLETLILKITGNAKTFDSRSFQDCTKLTNLTIIGEISKNGLNLQWSTNLTHDSLMSVINALTDKSNDTSGTVWEVVLGETNIAKLTDAEQEIPQQKGWIIS